MNIEELIIDKYYMCYDTPEYCFYFKFKLYTDRFIPFYNLPQKCSKTIEPSEVFCTLKILGQLFIVKEIDISEILDYIPDTNIDKKYFLRKEKIKFLLEQNVK